MTARKAVIVFLLLAAALTAGAQSFSPTNCILAGGQCDASNSCVSYTPDSYGFLQEQTLGTCDTPKIIVIGGGYDPPSAPPPGPYVAFINDTRSSDRVVSAKIDSEAQGTKELGVRVYPAGKSARLRIQRISGSAGSASFDAAGLVTTLPVVDGQRITIYGGTTSDLARNMAITANIDGVRVPGEFTFTVFRISPIPRTSGSPLETVLPDSAKAASGGRVVAVGDGGVNLLPRQLMRTLYKDAATISGRVITTLVSDGVRDARLMPDRPDYDRLGHRTLPNLGQYGGIVFKGNVVPKIEHTDFSRNITPFSVREGFDWRRTRTFIEKKIEPDGTTLTLDSGTNENDDATDSDEDLIPDDGAIWVFDTPAHIVRDPNVARDEIFDGDIVRGWFTFVEWAEYGGMRVSPKIDWYWRFSNLDPVDEVPGLVEETSQPGFNFVGVGKITIPSW